VDERVGKRDGFGRVWYVLTLFEIIMMAFRTSHRLPFPHLCTRRTEDDSVLRPTPSCFAKE
jgi:hypothetical protein